MNKDLFKSKIKKIIKYKKNLSESECSWLSGFFWSFKNNNNKINNNLIKNITIISSSQTGNARNLSEKLKKSISKLKFKIKLINAGDYKYKQINKEQILILITSTYGEGEPPEESINLYEFLKLKKIKFKKTWFSVFGLGDKSYKFFNKTAIFFDKKFKFMGGKRLIKRVEADIDYIKIFKIWKDKLIKKIKNKFINNKHIILDKTKNKIKNKYNNKNKTLKTKISIIQKISGNLSKKKTYHIEIELNKNKFPYKPGDVLGIWYENSKKLVNNFLKTLKVNLNTKIKINKKKINIVEAFRKKFELTVNNINFLTKYIKISKNKKLKKEVKKIKIKNYIKKYPIIKVIKKYPIKIKIKEFIKILRPLNPRFYSISSSQDEVENELHITINLISYKINNEIYYGGATYFLSKILKKNKNKNINIFLKTNNNFRLPKNNKIPIIMICAGTGIAPFRSFIQQRNFEKAKGKNWLFFGNQTFSEDFLYQTEWQKYLKNGILNKIDLAWSRDKSKYKYIQDKINIKSIEIWNWIKNGANIYICGNANKMAKEVEKNILKIISIQGKKNYEKSIIFLNKLRNKKRYQKDVY